MKQLLNFLSVCGLFCLFLFSDVHAQPFNGFLRFDGVDDALSIPASSVIPANSDFTIEFWFKTCTDYLSSSQALFGNSTKLEMNMFPSTNKTFYQLCMTTTSNTWLCFQDHQYPPDFKWHHVAITYDYSADEYGYFFDGIDGTISNSGYDYKYTPSSTLYMGRSGYRTWQYGFFNGYMDEIRISNIIRYSASFTPSTNEFITDTNTKGLWHCNDSNPLTKILDASGNNADFTIAGSPKTLNLENVIVQTGNLLTVTESFNSYQWVNCNNGNSEISNATSNNYFANLAGSYGITVTDDTCPLTTDCVDIQTTGLWDNLSKTKFQLYPNPTEGVIEIVVEEHEIKYELINNLGEIVDNGTLTKDLTSIDFTDSPKGVYFLKLYDGQYIAINKIVKQ